MMAARARECLAVLRWFLLGAVILEELGDSKTDVEAAVMSVRRAIG